MSGNIFALEWEVRGKTRAFGIPKESDEPSRCILGASPEAPGS